MKILILDDHKLVRAQIRHLLLQEITDANVFEAGNTIEANDLIANHYFDYVICDLELTKGSSLDLPIYCNHNNIPFMVISSHVNKLLIMELEKLNVACYVSKTSDLESISRGIEYLVSGRRYFCPLVQKTRSSKEKIVETTKLTLSKPQRAILNLLDKGYTRGEIAESLCKSPTTINNQLAIARDRNECNSTGELLRRFNFWE